jgi:hypothetical protein
VDGAYAGSAFICEEYRYLMKGLQVRIIGNFTGRNDFLIILVCGFI